MGAASPLEIAAESNSSKPPMETVEILKIRERKVMEERENLLINVTIFLTDFRNSCHSCIGVE